MPPDEMTDDDLDQAIKSLRAMLTEYRTGRDQMMTWDQSRTLQRRLRALYREQYERM